jgi:hypothetical protein
MCRPQEAGQTAEERHSCDYPANEAADELGPRVLAREKDEPMYNQRLNAPGGDSVHRLDYRGNGQTGCGGDGHPACDDPRASGHAYQTQASTMRCRGSRAARFSARWSSSMNGVTITG